MLDIAAGKANPSISGCYELGNERTASQMPQRPEIVESGRSSSAGVCILVADDFEAWRSQLRSFLERETRWKVFEACDGLEAVRKTIELQPDVVLLDVAMPGLNGIEAAKEIRKLSPDTRIVFLSQEGGEDVVAAALNTGASAYVLKNEMVSGLIPAIRACLWAKP